MIIHITIQRNNDIKIVADTTDARSELITSYLIHNNAPKDYKVNVLVRHGKEVPFSRDFPQGETLIGLVPGARLDGHFDLTVEVEITRRNTYSSQSATLLSSIAHPLRNLDGTPHITPAVEPLDKTNFLVTDPQDNVTWQPMSVDSGFFQQATQYVEEAILLGLRIPNLTFDKGGRSIREHLSSDGSEDSA